MNLIILAVGLCVLASYICFEVARAVKQELDNLLRCSLNELF